MCVYVRTVVHVSTVSWSILVSVSPDIRDNTVKSVVIYVFLGVTCENGGTCRYGIVEYTCQCVAGYTRQHCEVGSYLCVSMCDL